LSKCNPIGNHVHVAFLVFSYFLALNLILLGATIANPPKLTGDASGRPNVLFISVDDLRPQLGCYGHDGMVTPNLDALAASGTRFDRAYCNLPVCGPSRASIMTGLRPTPERFTKRTTMAEADAPEALPLHSHFRRHGYHTISNGKIFDQRMDHAGGWSEPPWRANEPGRFFDCYLLPESLQVERSQLAKEPVTRGRHRGPAFEAADVSDDAYTDGMTAQRAVKDLRRLVSQEKPFFLAVGFPRPHLPFIAPQRYWDLYDFDQIQIPSNHQFPATAPEIANRDWNELRLYAGMPEKGPLDDELARRLIHGYYACVSYVDAMVGLMLDELQRLGIAENTIVMLWGDHGFHLGEHGLWCKHTPFEANMHVPLIIRAPAMPGAVVSRNLVEFIDVYPTLCELAGLPRPEHLEGTSLVPLLRGDANVSHREFADREIALGRMYNSETIRTSSERYTEYFDLGTGMVKGRMLYDHDVDPDETNNLAELAEHQSRVQRLRDALRSRLPEPCGLEE